MDHIIVAYELGGSCQLCNVTHKVRLCVTTDSKPSERQWDTDVDCKSRCQRLSCLTMAEWLSWSVWKQRAALKHSEDQRVTYVALFILCKCIEVIVTAMCPKKYIYPSFYLSIRLSVCLSTFGAFWVLTLLNKTFICTVSYTYINSITNVENTKTMFFVLMQFISVQSC